MRTRGWMLLVLTLVFMLATTSVAVARMDGDGSGTGTTFAAYHSDMTDQTGRALGYWGAYEAAVKPYAPYTAGPVVAEEPYAPYTAGPVVREVPYAPYTAPSQLERYGHNFLVW